MHRNTMILKDPSDHPLHFMQCELRDWGGRKYTIRQDEYLQSHDSSFYLVGISRIFYTCAIPWILSSEVGYCFSQCTMLMALVKVWMKITASSDP